MEYEKICTTCGNSGVMLNGEVCPDCDNYKYKSTTLVDSEYLDIPEMYRAIRLEKDFLPEHMRGERGNTLLNLQTKIISGAKFGNICVAAPVKSAKSVFVYSTLEALYRKGIEIAPYRDVLEWYKDLDTSVDLYEANVIFIKLTTDLSYKAFDVLKTIIDRRNRRGGRKTTVIISDVPWSYVVTADRRKIISPLKGDGNFGTIEVIEFFDKEEVN